MAGMSVSLSTQLDPVTLSVIRSNLPAIADEMSHDLRRTSYNQMIYEVGDYSCALLDIQGQLLSQNNGGVSHFVSDLGVCIKDGMQRYGPDGFQPGDVLITNHQAVAGQHLNNILVYTPFFFEGKLTAFPAVRAHWIDIGGVSTGVGGGASAYDPWAEGLQLDQLKIYEAGEPNPLLIKIIRDNVRYPDGSMGDLRSQIAACRLAERRLDALYRRYGPETVAAAIHAIFEEAERRCRMAVEQIPDGVYEAESFIDNDGLERDKPVEFKVKVSISGSDMTIDLSECSQQRRGPMNSRTYAGAYIAYKALTTPLEPVNEGSFRALKAIIPEGNIMMARHPAAMSNWSGPIPAVVETIFKALSPAIPERVTAGNPGMMGPGNAFFGVNPKRGKRFILLGFWGNGWGGRPDQDGPSACGNVCQGDVRNEPVESIELKTPVIIEDRSLLPDSAGAGKWRGGFASNIRIHCLSEGRWNLFKPRRQGCPSWGLWGGKPGFPGTNFIKTAGDAEFRSQDMAQAHVPEDTVVVIQTTAGGGWGEPRERDPRLVLADVLDGLVSRDAAERDYCVLLTADGQSIDEAGTDRLRQTTTHPAFRSSDSLP
jgi:N-methylhydantoinase B